MNIAQIELEHIRVGRVRDLAGQALDLGEKIGSRRDVGVAQRLLTQAAALLDSRPFQGLFETGAQSLIIIKDRFELGRTWSAYAAALTQSGNRSAGRAYLKQAKDTFISIGANGELQRLRTIEERSVLAMSQSEVERVIGRAVTDAAFRKALIENAREACKGMILPRMS